MRFARIAHPDDERVVEHRAVAFGDGVEPLGQVRDPLGVELADRHGELVRAVHVADRVPVFHDAEFLPRVIRTHAARSVDRYHIRQPRCQRRRSDGALRLETIGRDRAVELVDRGYVGLQPVLVCRDLLLPGPHLLERVEVDVQLLAIHRGQFLANTLDVGAAPVEQLVSGVKRFPRLPLRHTAEERCEGEIRLTDDRRGTLGSTGRDAVDEHGAGAWGNPQTHDRNDAWLGPRQRMINGLPRDPLAPVEAAETAEALAMIAAAGDLVRELLDDPHTILERRQRRDRVRQFQILQGEIDQFFGLPVVAIHTFRLDVARVQAVALQHEDDARPRFLTRGLCLKRAQERLQHDRPRAQREALQYRSAIEAIGSEHVHVELPLYVGRVSRPVSGLRNLDGPGDPSYDRRGSVQE